jgi:hypothetical protein
VQRAQIHELLKPDDGFDRGGAANVEAKRSAETEQGRIGMTTTKRFALALVCGIGLVGAIGGLPRAGAQELETINMSYPESNAY